MPVRDQMLPRWIVMAALVVPAAIVAQGASDAPDLAMYARIRDEGMTRSRVMDYATELLDGIGPRLTGSPNLDKAIAWAMNRLREGGSSNVRKESWGEFGMGWRQRNAWVRLVEPDTANFITVAAPWSPPTPGPISADVVSVRGFTGEKGFEPLRGKLRGKIVLLHRAPSMPEAIPIVKPLFERLSDAQLAELARDPAPAPAEDPQFWEKAFAANAFLERVGRFFADEGVRAVIVPSGNNPHGGASGGTIYADSNYTFGLFVHEKAHAMRVPLVIVSIEDYGRLSRLLDRKVPVKVELNVDTEFAGDRVEAFNVFADIPGVDERRKDQVVMVGAHLDSWAAGTGATDDGAGVAIAMEAMRILNALRVQPRRTIRIALWTGEEQLVLGSADYVKRHIATIPRAATPEQLRLPEAWRRRIGPVVPKPEHGRLSGVYTIDLGGGRIRGMSLAGNTALVPIFQQWIAPLGDLGVTLVSTRGDACPGDCWPFLDAGIPTPGFKQDPLDYDTRTHHTNIDTYERLIPQDLRQAAVVTATMLYNTAMRDELLPRKPLPGAP